MDIDGLQKQIQDLEFLLQSITGLSQQKSMQIENGWNWNSNHKTDAPIKFEIEDEDDNDCLKTQIQNYQQKIAKLELDLKREIELKHVKYYRADRKANEIKRLIQEKDDVLKKCMNLESIIKDLEIKHLKIENEYFQIEQNLEIKIRECDELNIKILEITEENNKVNPKYTERIQELECEIDELKQLIKSFEIMTKKNTVPDSTKEVLEKLSVMLLNKNTNPNFFSEQQKSLIRSLFGDYATITYKDKINELEITASKHNRDRINAIKIWKRSVEKALFYLNILWKISDKIDQENFNFNRHSCSQFIPSKEALIDDKIVLIEKVTNIDKWLSKEEINEDSVELSSFVNAEIQSQSKSEKELLLISANNSYNFE